MALTLRTALAQAKAQLSHSDSAELDAQLLLAQVLGQSRSWLYTWPEHELSLTQAKVYDSLIQRRSRGEPLAYLTGHRAFWKLDLQVSPAVLIPRPETELLVELALELGRALPGPVADLGTGSGAIALALALERPDWQVHASELSEDALPIVTANVQQYLLTNVSLFCGSWCEPLPATHYGLIVSNPPYIEEADPHLQQDGLDYEPRMALVSAQHGLADLRDIAIQARHRLVCSGWLLLEHGWQQGEQVRALLAAAGYQQIATHQDHAARDRVTLGRWLE